VHQEVRGRVCDNAACRQALIHLHRHRAQAHQAEVAISMGLTSREELPLVMVPAYGGSLGNLSARRQRRFRDYLNQQISLAFARSPTEARDSATESAPLQAEPSAAQTTGLGKACANCRGYCCAMGAEHAWLNEPTIRRYVSNMQGIRPREVLQTYLNKLPQKSYRGSCVYHTAQGCALPRSMRSSVCNDYYCSGLQEFWRVLENSQASPVLVVAMEGYAVARSVVVAEGQC